MQTNKINIAIILHPIDIKTFFSHLSVFYKPYSAILNLFINRINPYYIKRFFSKLPSHKFMEVEFQIAPKKIISILGIMCPLFPEEMIFSKDRAIQKILDATRLAMKEGCQFVSLAGFSSIVTSGGEDIAKNIKDITITSGNTLTASLIIDGIEKAANLFSRKLEQCEMSIIGATGDIGNGCADMFSDNVKKIVLCSRNIKESDQFVQKLLLKQKAIIKIEQNVKEAVRNSDLVITATSSLGSLLSYKDFKNGAIVCDASMPPNVALETNSLGHNIFIFDGGRAQIGNFDKIRNKQWQSLFPNNSIYGCLSESIVLALEGRTENYSLGKGNISVKKIQEIKAMAVKNGIYLADFYRGNRKCLINK